MNLILLVIDIVFQSIYIYNEHKKGTLQFQVSAAIMNLKTMQLGVLEAGIKKDVVFVLDKETGWNPYSDRFPKPNVYYLVRYAPQLDITPLNSFELSELGKDKMYVFLTEELFPLHRKFLDAGLNTIIYTRPICEIQNGKFALIREIFDILGNNNIKVFNYGGAKFCKTNYGGFVHHYFEHEQLGVLQKTVYRRPSSFNDKMYKLLSKAISSFSYKEVWVNSFIHDVMDLLVSEGVLKYKPDLFLRPDIIGALFPFKMMLEPYDVYFKKYEVFVVGVCFEDICINSPIAELFNFKALDVIRKEGTKFLFTVGVDNIPMIF